MNYSETVEHLYSRLPYFTRDGKAALKPDLTNTLKLCEALGNPQNKFKSIHVAGTNGKGSTSNILSAIFQQHGYKTGLYTSPHLLDFRERIRINGVMIPQQFVVDFVAKNDELIETIKPSFFEVTVALCFLYFAEENIDIAIIETGLGGRLDSTNIITPELSVITNIGLDHTDLLGDSLEKIAWEKAGIIKQNVATVIGESHPETDSVFIEKARSVNAPIFFADKDLMLAEINVESDLKGSYQKKNIQTVLKSLSVLETEGFTFERNKVQSALLNVQKLTGFSGRWEIIQESGPKIIADTGHNAHGLTLVTEQLSKESFDKLHIIFGMVSDKDRTPVLNILPKNAQYYFCKPALPRALDAEILRTEAEGFDLKGNSYESVISAYLSALKNANNNDLIFIGGSTFVVAEIMEYLQNNKSNA
ncbi:MAG: bifunctional folylpolyglutamate synthase/dihydrofolate synthase [Bacteroidia bacterium]|nr:bifunctional folylpolyglutamate synthase/dihydrofolate synthase [Bacteroidia bacterium]